MRRSGIKPLKTGKCQSDILFFKDIEYIESDREMLEGVGIGAKSYNGRLPNS